MTLYTQKYEQIIPSSTILGKKFQFYKNILPLSDQTHIFRMSKLKWVKQQECGMTEKAKYAKKTRTKK